ncbi:hypothetical protein [Sphingobium lignivorans]|uniref:DUF2336 domain-containing protein n=1 Tax=Sphingobium lignivorans TaxID=2735886 RepID=A0ABR6NIQ9_9SPHN|nr:hypothetical protein [Sphingobium lignivorans]MBB5986079.1 hypothetical protein [Sphingobium lignivorans]
MSMANDPVEQRPYGVGERPAARLSRRLIEDVRHGTDLAWLAAAAPRRWTDALLAETRFHLAGMMNTIELAIGLHVGDPHIEALLSDLGTGYARRAIESDLDLLSPELLGHLRRRAAVALLLRNDDAPGGPASFAALASGAGNDIYIEALTALGIAEKRWSAPMLLDAPMRPDLPAEHYHDLAWTVAALLIRGCERFPGLEAPAAVKAIARATEQLIGRHDEGQGAFALARRCARSLPSETRHALASAALVDARLLLFAALAESETGLPLDDVLDAMIDLRDEPRLALLRLMRVGDAVAFRAAELLAPLNGMAAGGDAALVAFIEDYRRYTSDRAVSWLDRMSGPRALADKLALLDRVR